MRIPQNKDVEYGEIITDWKRNPLVLTEKQINKQTKSGHHRTPDHIQGTQIHRYFQINIYHYLYITLNS